MSISDLPECKTYGFICILARNAVRAGMYNKWVQQNLVQVTHIPLNMPLWLDSLF